MPSAVLQALYEHRDDLAERLASQTPHINIFEAAAIGNEPRVRELLTSDAALAKAFSDDGFTPLHLAVFFARTACVQALLEAGADVNARSQNEMHVRPIHSAVTARSLPCVELLLLAGADPNVQQRGGYTPLHSATHNGAVEIEARLRENGADPTIASNDGKVAEDFRRQ